MFVFKLFFIHRKFSRKNGFSIFSIPSRKMVQICRKKKILNHFFIFSIFSIYFFCQPIYRNFNNFIFLSVKFSKKQLKILNECFLIETLEYYFTFLKFCRYQIFIFYKNKTYLFVFQKIETSITNRRFANLP